MKRLGFALIGLIAMGSVAGMGVGANAQETTETTNKMTESQHLAHLSFETTDRTQKGYVDLGDMENQRKLIFISMDADENLSIDLNEFMGWGYGFQLMADESNKRLAYDTALKVVFRLWDRNGNGSINETEHRKAIIADFQRADANHNSVLERSEFLEGFSILVAIRAALKP